LDAPGTLHHVMVRGIEKRLIFKNDRDREDFIDRLGQIIQEGHGKCFAWALMPNHAHVLLRTGPTPLARMMRRLLTGYAVSFNLRHQRSGHLFQNRYRSIVCEEDAYLLELVRYIHLNPFRANLVKDIDGLDRYRWSGHSVLMGRGHGPWQAKDEVLSYFGTTEKVARSRYRRFVSEGIGLGRRSDLSIGNAGLKGAKVGKEKGPRGDPRILGQAPFIEEVLVEADRYARERVLSRGRPADVDGLLKFITQEMEVTREEILGRSRRREISEARSVLCYVCLRRLGMTGTQLVEMLQMSSGGVHTASDRGETFMKENADFERSLRSYLNN